MHQVACCDNATPLISAYSYWHPTRTWTTYLTWIYHHEILKNRQQSLAVTQGLRVQTCRAIMLEQSAQRRSLLPNESRWTRKSNMNSHRRTVEKSARHPFRNLKHLSSNFVVCLRMMESSLTADGGTKSNEGTWLCFLGDCVQQGASSDEALQPVTEVFQRHDILACYKHEEKTYKQPHVVHIHDQGTTYRAHV
jgi:hypothetical protein